MKTIIKTTTLVAAVLLLTTLTAGATGRQAIKNASESVKQEIIRGISCPDFIDGKDQAVNQIKALVDVDSTGKVTVEQINSANPQLKEYVVNQLQNIKVKNPGQSQRFVLVINFQVS